MCARMGLSYSTHTRASIEIQVLDKRTVEKKRSKPNEITSARIYACKWLTMFSKASDIFKTFRRVLGCAAWYALPPIRTTCFMSIGTPSMEHKPDTSYIPFFCPARAMEVLRGALARRPRAEANARPLTEETIVTSA